MTRTRTGNLTAILLGLLTAGLSPVSDAQTTNFLVAQFDADTTGQFVYWPWGAAYPSITWEGDEPNHHTRTKHGWVRVCAMVH